MPPLPAFFLLLLLLAGFVPPAAAQSPPTLSLQPGGMLTRMGHILPPTEVYFESNAEIDGLRGATGVTVSGDGDLLFVSARNSQVLSVWQVNAEAGTLSQTALYQDSDVNEMEVNYISEVDGRFDGLDAATGVAVSGDGALLFVTGQFDDALSVWRVNAEAGTLSQTALYQDSGTDETATHHIGEVDGRFDGLDGAFGAAVSGDGALLFVIGSITLSVWRVNAEAGTLSQTALYRNDGQDPNDASKRIGGLRGANDIALSGDLLFVAAVFSDALSVWRVNAEAGTLSQTAVYQDKDTSGGNFIDNVDGRFDGLDGAFGAAVSGDGALLFVTGILTLSVWRVNAEAGTLSQTALYQDSEVDETDVGYIREVDGRFDSLSDARSAAVSGDGALLFVTASFDSALSVWRVNAEAGTLSQTVVYRDGVGGIDDGGIDGLFGANGIAVSSDLLFVTGTFDNALSTWRINSAEVSLEVPTVISMQSDLPVAEEVMVTVTARNSTGTYSVAARPVTLSPDKMSADAIFPPGALIPSGRWIFTAQAQPPAALDTRAARIAMRVLPPLLSLEPQQDQFALGSTVALTVRTIAGLPAAASYAIDAINTAEESTATITVEYPAGDTEQEVFFPAQQIASLGLGQLDFSIRLPDNSPFRVGDGSTATVQIVIPQLRLVPLQQQFALGSTVILTVRADAGAPTEATYDIIARHLVLATTFSIEVTHPAGVTAQEVSVPARLFSSTEQWEFSIRLPDGSPFRIGDDSTATVQIVNPQLRLVPLPEQFALGSTVLLTVRADAGAPTEATYDIIARHLVLATTFSIEVTHPAGVTAQEVSVPAQQITSPGQWEFSIQLPEDSPFQVIANGTATVYVAPVLSLLPQRESFPAGVAVNIEVQAESPPAVAAAVTITARRQQDGVEVNAAEAVTLSPEVLSGQAVFLASALGDGEWVFTAQSEPPEALYTANARAEAAVLSPPLRLEVSAPPSVTVGNTFTVTVGVAAGMPLPEGVSVTATVSFGATDSEAIAEREVTLTGEPRTATEEFTAPVRSGIFRVEVSGPAAVSGRAVIGASASVTVVPVAVMLQLSAPDAVPVRQGYQVTVDTNMPVSAGTTLEVTVTASAGTDLQVQVVLLTADNSEEVPFTAPLNVGEVIVTARAEVQTAPDAREVAVAAAMTQTVQVLAEGTVALTLDAPLSVTVGDTFTVTVGVAEETPLPESVSVTATISLLAANGEEIERKEVVLTSASSSFRTAFTAPVTAGLFTVEVSGREEAGSIDGVAGTSAQVSVEAVAVRLQLSGPATVLVEQGYQVTVGTNMPVPEGTTLEVTVTASAGIDLQEQVVLLTADNSEDVPFTAPRTAGAVMVTAMAEVQTAADAREVAVPDATTLAVLIVTPATLRLQPEGMLTRMEHAVLTDLHLNAAAEIDGLQGAQGVAVSGDLLFVTGSDNSALSVWRVDAEAGTLRQTVVYRDDEGGIDGLEGAFEVVVSASGDLLFVTADTDDALSVWQVNAEEATLSQMVVYQNGQDLDGDIIAGLAGANGAVLSGDLLFVAGFSDDALSVWRVNEASGTLRQTAVYKNGAVDNAGNRVDGLGGAAVVDASDDLLFVTGATSDAISVWRVNESLGTLEQTAVYQNEVAGIRGLDNPQGVEVSGSLLFVTAFNGNALSVWRINAEAGTLRQTVVYQDNEGGVDGLDTATGVAVSSDGNLLFATGINDNALSIWRVNAEAGTLRQTVVYQDGDRDGDSEIDGLAGANNVVVSGDLLFVTAINDNALSAWHINNAEVPFGVPIMISVQSDIPVLQEVVVTVTARNGADTAAVGVSLSPEDLSAQAIFAADTLGPGRWIFTAEAESPALLDTGAARIAVQVLAPVRLTLAAPGNVTVDTTFAVTVGVAAGTPLPEGTAVTATLSFRAGGGDDRVVMLTSEMSSATEIFTAPVTAGIFRVEVSGRAMIGTSASVIVEPVAVVLRLNGPQEAVTVGQTYTVTVDTNMPVPTGTTLEVTVSAGTAPQEVLFLTADNPSEDIPFTAPRTAGAVMVTATATVQTAVGALEVAVSDAATLAVTVSARDVQLVLSGVPDLVAAGSTFPVTVGTEPALPEGARVMARVSLAAFSSEPVTLMPSAPTASVIVAAPPAGGAATLSVTGEEAADSVQLNVLAAEAVTVQVQVQVSLSLRLEAPPEVTARDSFAVTVFTEPEVPGGATVTVTVAFDGTDSSPVVLSAEMASTAVMFRAPSRIENDLELMTSSVVTVADANVLQVVVTEASATVNAAAQSVQLTLVAMPERVAAGQEVAVTAGVSPALLADTTLTVKVFFGEASSRQVTLSDKASSQEVSFPTSATGTLEVRAQAVEVEPADLVVAAAAPTQTVEVLAEGTVELTLDAPKSVTVGSTFPVTVGVTAGTPLPVGSSVSATLSFSARDGDEREVILTSKMSSAMETFTAPRRSGIFVVAARGAEDSLAIRFVVDTSAQVSVEPVRVTLTLRGPDAVTVGETYQVMVGTNMAVPEGTTLEVTVSAGTTLREVSLAADNSAVVSFTAPARADPVTVTATATVQTDADALEVAVSDAEPLTVSVSARDVQLVLSAFPRLVAAGSPFPVTVGAAPEVPEGTTVMVTVSLGNSSAPATLTPRAATERVLVTAPTANGTAILSAAGKEAAAGALELNVLPAETTVQVQVQVLQLGLQRGQPLTAGSTVILTVQPEIEPHTAINYTAMALHTVSEMTTSVLTIHPAGTTEHSVSFSGQQIASPGLWEFSILPAELPFESMPITVTISLDFIQPQGIINADDLLFALRYLVRCEGSAAECQANGEDLASLARNLGNALQIEQLPVALQFPDASSGGEERPAANWFTLLLGLQGLPVELLFPASEQKPSQLENAIRSMLSVQEQEE